MWDTQHSICVNSAAAELMVLNCTMDQRIIFYNTLVVGLPEKPGRCVREKATPK